MAGIRWTEGEDQILRENYGNLSRTNLVELFPNRTWPAIKIRARRLHLTYCMGVHEYVGADLTTLLQEIPSAYYWMGFLAADGSICDNRLKLALANQDRDHLIKFCDFVCCSNYHQTKDKVWYVAVQDKYTIPAIADKYNLKRAKTYNPPDITWMKDDLCISFIIGFVDGDGCIGKQSGRNDCVLRIKNHASWLSVLQYMLDVISTTTTVVLPKAKIDSLGYANLIISNSMVLKFLKKKTRELDLPVLNRKWIKIDETFVSRIEQAAHNEKQVLGLKAMKLRNVEIARITGLSQSAISVIIKRAIKGSVV